MFAVVHVAVLVAAHSRGVAAAAVVFLHLYTQYQLLSFQDSAEQVIFHRSVFPLSVAPAARFA
jgi:hypothetical protein